MRIFVHQQQVWKLPISAAEAHRRKTPNGLRVHYCLDETVQIKCSMPRILHINVLERGQHGLHSDSTHDEVPEVNVSVLATVPHDQSTECSVTQAETASVESGSQLVGTQITTLVSVILLEHSLPSS